jgi:hypothetical protein
MLVGLIMTISLSFVGPGEPERSGSGVSIRNKLLVRSRLCTSEIRNKWSLYLSIHFRGWNWINVMFALGIAEPRCELMTVK